MAKIEPMLLNEIFYNEQMFEEQKNRLFQIKENGIRGLVHIKDGIIIGIRNRNDKPILFCFPEFKGLKLDIKEGILDCEIVVLDKERSIFYGGINQRRSVPTNKILEEYPATIIVFDALKIDSEVLLLKPYKYRYEKIKNSVFECERIRIAKNYSDLKELWNLVTKNNFEGVVIKNPDSVYEMGKRSSNYIKVKYYKYCEVIVEETVPNDKGTKIIGKTIIDKEEIVVECQIPGDFDINKGDVKKIKYLDVYNGKLIQPTRR